MKSCAVAGSTLLGAVRARVGVHAREQAARHPLRLVRFDGPLGVAALHREALLLERGEAERHATGGECRDVGELRRRW